jgi:DNA-binding MarR family transcriptional regulator
MQGIGGTKNGAKDRAGDFLELFYPIHYKLGMALEDALRVAALSRKQVAILWLIRCEGEGGRSIRRKDVQRLLTEWFEISSPSVSKALRSMSRPPLDLVRILEDPHSGREKRLELTTKGEQFISAMTERGRAFFSPIITEMSTNEAEEGLRFLQNVTAILERSLQRIRPQVAKKASLASPKNRRGPSLREGFLAVD